MRGCSKTFIHNKNGHKTICGTSISSTEPPLIYLCPECVEMEKIKGSANPPISVKEIDSNEKKEYELRIRKLKSLVKLCVSSARLINNDSDVAEILLKASEDI